MAVYFYGEGDHPAGFVGYRVVTTIGEADLLRQRYFALSQYSPREASHLADELDAKWRAEAEIVKRENRIRRGRTNGGPGIIAMGLRAAFRVERGRKSHYGTYVTPCFIVGYPGYGKGQQVFATTVHGFNGAFEKAVDLFCDIHLLSASERESLMRRRPAKTLFCHTLRLNLLKKGLIITEAEVKGKLTRVKER
ncbi:hypothetical protein ACK249_006295 [Pseudomonas aeruginosa]|uniref:hypothetical protein n=1 Tax=Pseudomonas aeruginosa TaxID=287 RepID=UPI00155E3BC6|nr:hypothetical protein [Pseudomonas aeruginosa]EIU2701727.1 hypothetical protein [Pseudomonas aeruginosa]EKW9640182.1 hypothetical protein [Pseudomonas aeruginosa]NRC33907.1 hypothetical protein [Pseudomonas aeruginosa]